MDLSKRLNVVVRFMVNGNVLVFGCNKNELVNVNTLADIATGN